MSTKVVSVVPSANQQQQIATKALINSQATTTTTTTTTKVIVNNAANAMSQLSTISLMLEYDIDNTLNTIKENGGHLIKDISQYSTTNAIATAVTTATATTTNNLQTTKATATPASLEKPQLPPTPPATPNLQTTARKRWRILAKVLRKDSEETVSSSGEDEERTASVRRFKSFDLLRQDSFEDHMSLNCLGKPENWYKYRVVLDGEGQLEYSVNIHHMERHLTASDLMGFNNTGNICVWPSEEALTAFVLSDLPAYKGKWILELGGGFTCLTGLMLSKYAKPYAVHLTDGNEVSVENVKKTVCLNELSCYTKCSVLKWEDETARSPAESSKFDIILSADCLFFDEARSALIDTIWYYLAPQGVALIMAPQRGKTMTLFVEACVRGGFCVQRTQRYNETIWQRHLALQGTQLYDEDLHYPVLLRLTKEQTLEATMRDDCEKTPEN